LKTSDLFTVQITAVSHGYVIRTTKGEAFAYETKEALLNAFADMFGIQPLVSSNAPHDPIAKEPIETSGSSSKNGRLVSKLKAEEIKIETEIFKEADPFLLRNHRKHNVGSSLFYREGDTIAIKRKGCPEVVHIKDAEVDSLSAKNKEEFCQYTGSIGKVKQDILWGYLEDLRDDSLGCFRKLKIDTRADGKLDSLMEDDV
jgi:hypothetical protein